MVLYQIINENDEIFAIILCLIERLNFARCNKNHFIFFLHKISSQGNFFFVIQMLAENVYEVTD